MSKSRRLGLPRILEKTWKRMKEDGGPMDEFNCKRTRTSGIPRNCIFFFFFQIFLSHSWTILSSTYLQKSRLGTNLPVYTTHLLSLLYVSSHSVSLSYVRREPTCNFLLIFHARSCVNFPFFLGIRRSLHFFPLPRIYFFNSFAPFRVFPEGFRSRTAFAVQYLSSLRPSRASHRFHVSARPYKVLCIS